MALLSSALSVFPKFVYTSPSLTCNGFVQQVRNKWTKKMNLRDMKRREVQRKWAPERLRLLALKRNDILPQEIRDQASQTFKEVIPAHTGKLGVCRRCVVTSRGYGTVYRWRISRFVFRHLADYNKMAGVQRAMW